MSSQHRVRGHADQQRTACGSSTRTATPSPSSTPSRAVASSSEKSAWAPRSVALSPIGEVWVTNKQSRLDQRHRCRDPGSRPHDRVACGLAALRHRRLARRAASCTSRSRRRGGCSRSTPRAMRRSRASTSARIRASVSVSGDGNRVYVSRFITPPLPGESTAVVQTATGGGEIVVVDGPAMSVAGHDRAAAQRQARCRKPGPRRSELPRRSRDFAGRPLGLGALQAGQRQARLAAQQSQPHVPEHGPRDQLAHRPAVGRRGLRPAHRPRQRRLRERGAP